jgi:predicted acyltransferase
MAENQRYLALDVFRGLTVCLMIIVNSPGHWQYIYAPFQHASWHGFTPTDLVFPSFLFAVGNAMAFAMVKYESQGSGIFWQKTIKRTVIIFLLGFLMYWFPFWDFQSGSMRPFSETRILGVLQRIALCYFFASIILHYGKIRFAIWFSAFALLGYWLILYVYGDANDPYSLTGYAGNSLDFAILGEKHIYNGEGVPFEPEGILSTLPSIVNVLAGFIAGAFIRNRSNQYENIAKVMMAGAVLITVAMTWNMAFPINKKIWTSSFVLLTVGLDLAILGILIYVIEVQKKIRWTKFFLVFGKNPLFIYLLSEILLITLFMIPVGRGNAQQWLYNLFGFFASPINASLLFAIFFMLVCWGVGYVLDKKKIYIKV